MRQNICLKANKVPQNKHTPFAPFSFYWIEFHHSCWWIFTQNSSMTMLSVGILTTHLIIRKSENLFYFISRWFHHHNHYIVAVSKCSAVLKQKKTFFFYFYNTMGIYQYIFKHMDRKKTTRFFYAENLKLFIKVFNLIIKRSMLFCV